MVPSQKDLGPNFLDYKDKDKGLHPVSVHITYLMGSAESSLLGLNSQRATMLLKDLPSHRDTHKNITIIYRIQLGLLHCPDQRTI